jgi:hypothetical protein
MSMSFSAAASDLQTWIADTCELEAKLVAAGIAATGADVAIAPLALDTPAQERTGPTAVPSAKAHFCVSFGSDSAAAGMVAHDRLFFAAIGSDAFRLSPRTPGPAYWHGRHGLFLVLERRVEKPASTPVPRVVTEPLVFTVRGSSRTQPAEGN